MASPATSGKHLYTREDDPRGNSFGAYFDSKKRKLREQFIESSEKQKEDGAASDSSSSIFQNVVIYVDGHTRPSLSELKDLVFLHGGALEQYYSRPRVTHYICEKLPISKVKQLKSEKNPPIVVTPSWIVQCIEQKKRLPESDFILTAMKESGGQKGLSSFFAAPAAPKDKKPKVSIDSEVHSQTKEKQEG